MSCFFFNLIRLQTFIPSQPSAWMDLTLNQKAGISSTNQWNQLLRNNVWWDDNLHCQTLGISVSALISTLRAPEPPTAVVSHLQQITVHHDAAVLRYLNNFFFLHWRYSEACTRVVFVLQIGGISTSDVAEQASLIVSVAILIMPGLVFLCWFGWFELSLLFHTVNYQGSLISCSTFTILDNVCHVIY